jgi:hypothetical protein
MLDRTGSTAHDSPMRTHAELAVALIEGGRREMTGSLRALTLEEALNPAGGYRSPLGILKHAAAWSQVYYSYAFEPVPKHWQHTEWPRGMRDTIDPSQAYVDEVRSWFERSTDAWKSALAPLSAEAFDQPHRLHWGATMPLFDVVTIIANHAVYHAGEINALVAITHGHAWEYTEEVEEKHILTANHRIRPDWMSDANVRSYEAYIAQRDNQLRES